VLGKKGTYVEGAEDMLVVEAWHTERGGMEIILGKKSSNKIEISALGKKGTYVGAPGVRR
jgi:hypothetical protein